MTSNINGGGHHGHPPKKFQFQKGVSGNPRGRPKGTRNLRTDLAEELAEKIPIREDGRTRRISKQRAMIKGAVAKAIQGDQRALSNIIALQLRFFADEMANDNQAATSPQDRAILDDFLRRYLERQANKDK